MGYGLILNFLKILLRNINSPLKNTFRGLSVCFATVENPRFYRGKKKA